MADVTGPISTLPNSLHKVQDGTMCDDHADRPAVARVQGETDSFGSEMNDLCQECLDAHRAYRCSVEARSGTCDWCKADATDLVNTRDYDEGMYGPVYHVCKSCSDKQQEALREELSRFEPLDDYYDDGDL